MQTLFSHTYATSVGPVRIVASATGVTSLEFPGKTGNKSAAGGADAHASSIVQKPNAITNQCANELMEYLAAKRRYFDIPLDLTGSDYELQVWKTLQSVPYASTATCMDIAAQLGNPQGYRAVSRAISKNAMPLLIPDHRIVDATGSSLGTGNVARRRQALLQFELMHAGLA